MSIQAVKDLYIFMKVSLSALTGEYIASEEFEATPAVMSEMINAEHHKSVAGHVATEDIIMVIVQKSW